MQLLSHGNPFHEALYTVFELIWRPHEVWRSVAIGSAESCRTLRTMLLSIRWPRPVIYVAQHLVAELLLFPIASTLLCYHWQLTVEYLVARKFHDWTCRTGCILSRYHAGIHWAPESDPFFYKCLWKQFEWLGAWLYTPVVMEVIGTPEFNYLDEWVNTFGNIVYVTICKAVETLSCDKLISSVPQCLILKKKMLNIPLFQLFKNETSQFTYR